MFKANIESYYILRDIVKFKFNAFFDDIFIVRKSCVIWRTLKSVKKTINLKFHKIWNKLHKLLTLMRRVINKANQNGDVYPKYYSFMGLKYV